MTVTHKNYDGYLAIKNCKYQKTFPSFKGDSLYIICVRGVDISDLAPYQYAPKCKECIGKGCADMEERK